MLYSRMTLVKTQTKDESKMNKNNNFLCPCKKWYERKHGEKTRDYKLLT